MCHCLQIQCVSHFKLLHHQVLSMLPISLVYSSLFFLVYATWYQLQITFHLISVPFNVPLGIFPMCQPLRTSPPSGVKLIHILLVCHSVFFHSLYYMVLAFNNQSSNWCAFNVPLLIVQICKPLHTSPPSGVKYVTYLTGVPFSVLLQFIPHGLSF